MLIITSITAVPVTTNPFNSYSSPISKQVVFYDSFENNTVENSNSLLITQFPDGVDSFTCSYATQHSDTATMDKSQFSQLSIISELESNDSLIIVAEPEADDTTESCRSHELLPHHVSILSKALVTHQKCCSYSCLSYFTASEVGNALNFFRSKSSVEQNQFLLDSFKVLCNEHSTNHLICGKQVCKKAYIQILGISEKRYKKILRVFKANPTVKFDRKPVIRSLSTKVTEAKAWMNRYFHRIGDCMPHIDQIHLPYGLTKGDIYLTMKAELVEQGLLVVVSRSHFYKIWNASFKKVVIPKVWSKHLSVLFY